MSYGEVMVMVMMMVMMLMMMTMTMMMMMMMMRMMMIKVLSPLQSIIWFVIQTKLPKRQNRGIKEISLLG